MDDSDERIMTGDAEGQPHGGTCPACKRAYQRALTFTDGDGVIRGEITGDVCITPDYLFAHSEITITAPDDEFPTRRIGAMGNRKEVSVEPTAVTGVWASDDKDGFVIDDASE
jgi:hypothetical protein